MFAGHETTANTLGWLVGMQLASIFFFFFRFTSENNSLQPKLAASLPSRSSCVTRSSTRQFTKRPRKLHLPPANPRRMHSSFFLSQNSSALISSQRVHFKNIFADE